MVHPAGQARSSRSDSRQQPELRAIEFNRRSVLTATSGAILSFLGWSVLQIKPYIGTASHNWAPQTVGEQALWRWLGQGKSERSLTVAAIWLV